MTGLQLIAKLYGPPTHLIEESPSEAISDGSILVQNYIRQIKKIIHSQYGISLRVGEITDKLNFNRSYFYRIFKEETGCSIKDYIIQVRIEKSADLLINTTFHILEVANAVGFTNGLTFNKTFKKYFNQSPSNYCKTLKN